LFLTLIVVAISFSSIQKLEEDLTKKERLAVLGELGAGIGHEIRNPLSSIKSVAYYLRAVNENPSAEVNEAITILDRESLRIEEIVDSLLTFAHPKPPTLVHVALDRVVKDALAELTIPEKIAIVTIFEPDLPAIHADYGQVVTIAKNIIANALQIMSTGGQLTIETKSEGSSWVILSIADTGSGIPKASMDRLFQPLFTTKAQGIGLGLPIAKSLIEGHNGTISVESEIGKGTLITLKFPRFQSKQSIES
jgi:signal transduction histidine kinase